jgi:predicted nuclease of predicted toxin-antitoxin system
MTTEPPPTHWRFLVDENLPRELAEQLRSVGHDAVHVYEADLRGAADERLFAYAQEHARCIITADLGFGNPHQYPPPHTGIIVARLPDTLSTDSRTRIIVQALKTVYGTDMGDLLVTVEPNRVRIHR